MTNLYNINPLCHAPYDSYSVAAGGLRMYSGAKMFAWKGSGAYRDITPCEADESFWFLQDKRCKSVDTSCEILIKFWSRIKSYIKTSTHTKIIHNINTISNVIHSVTWRVTRRPQHCTFTQTATVLRRNKIVQAQFSDCLFHRKNEQRHIVLERIWRTFQQW